MSGRGCCANHHPEANPCHSRCHRGNEEEVLLIGAAVSDGWRSVFRRASSGTFRIALALIALKYSEEGASSEVQHGIHRESQVVLQVQNRAKAKSGEHEKREDHPGSLKIWTGGGRNADAQRHKWYDDTSDQRYDLCPKYKGPFGPGRNTTTNGIRPAFVSFCRGSPWCSHACILRLAPTRIKHFCAGGWSSSRLVWSICGRQQPKPPHITGAAVSDRGNPVRGDLFIEPDARPYPPFVFARPRSRVRTFQRAPSRAGKNKR